MKPRTGDQPQQLKVTQLEDGDDFLFDPEAVCAEMRLAQAKSSATSARQRLQVMRRFRHLLAEQAESVAVSAITQNVPLRFPLPSDGRGSG